jgi:dTDP-4-amino-4,6-dideoxygalactose transaminase
MMQIQFVDLHAQYLSIKTEIDAAIEQCLTNTSFIGGAPVKNFEKEFAAYAGVKHCIGVANGTDAIEIALKVLNIGPGDEVIVPAHTWISTAGSVVAVGATPVFADTLPGKYTIDPAHVRNLITPKTKAIIPVHLYGLAAQMDQIMSIANEHNLKVLEDCAQAHGATFDGKNIGTFGHISTFSFYPGKNLGAYGDAGCITTNNDELAEQCRTIANHGQLKKNNHLTLGRNSRLDALQAAILSVKLRHLDKWTNQRIAHAKTYRTQLTGSNLVLPSEQADSKHVYHLFVVQSEDRDGLKSFLAEKGIPTAIHYPKALPFVKPFERPEHTIAAFPESGTYTDKILSLPMYAEMTTETIDYICQTIKNG